MGDRGFLQGNQADSPTGRFPRNQRKRHQVADLDGSAYLFAAAPGSMDRRLEKIISTVLSAREGCHLESKKLATLISLIKKRNGRHLHPSACPLFRCSSTSAISERQIENLTKTLFQNDSPSRRNMPRNSPFLHFYGISVCGTRFFPNGRLHFPDSAVDYEAAILRNF